jgi:hypothetical protein
VFRAAAGETVNNKFLITLNEALLWVSFTLQPVIEAGKIVKLAVEGHDITVKQRLTSFSQQTAVHADPLPIIAAEHYSYLKAIMST